MKILITGYNGFIGKHLVRALGKYRLLGVDLENGDLVEEHKSWSEIESVKNIDCVIHLAGIAHDTERKTNFIDYYTVNVGLTKKIFDVFLKSHATKLIYFSSVAAVTDSLPVGEVLTESTLAHPHTHYGKSKLAAEKYINDQILPEGKKVYILRPSMVHGPGNRGNLPMLFRYVKKGFPWPLGGYENKRTFTYIENLVFIIQKLIEKDIEPGTYQVCDDDSVSTNDLVRIIMESLHKPVRIWYISPSLIKFLTKAGSIFGVPIIRYRLKKLTTSFEVSNQKIKNAIGIEKMPFGAIEGFKISVESLIEDYK